MSRALLARALAWALWWGAWLVLGELGRRFTPLWADGLLPLALWLATVGVGARWLARAVPSARVLQWLLPASAGAGAVALALCHAGGGAAALLGAALAWGLLTAAAQQLAWGVGARMDARRAAAWQPMGWSCLVGGGAGDAPVTRITRAAMLPMMASLGLMSDQCAAAGVGPTLALGLHLAAMLLPAWLLRRLGRQLRHPAWLAVPMGASVLALLVLPGVQGWMAAALAQSIAWGLACTPAGSAHGPRAARAPGASRWSGDVLPAAAVALLGGAVAAFGPGAVPAVQLALGLFAVGAAAAMGCAASGSDVRARWARARPFRARWRRPALGSGAPSARG